MPTRIVVAEDEAIIRMDLRELLVEEGYEVVGECGRGDEAVALIRSHRPDVALLDIKMPGMDGISAARQVAAEQLTAVVLVTAFSQRELIEEASDAGVHGYVVKPFERHDLVPAIEVALARFRSTQQLAEQVTTVEQRLSARIAVDRAKGVLMDSVGLNEQESFDFIQKTAMSTRRSMADISQDVIDGVLRP
ncbi:MAG: response regulator [Actinobacteria bacterium]|nr:response regulator [Actinomycetota bacterium]